MKTYYQQGDVILRPASVPKSAKKRNSLVLAEGEMTGHKHEVMGDAETFILDQNIFLVVYDDVVLNHQEHNPISLPPGSYAINIVREYDHFDEEAREVMD